MQQRREPSVPLDGRRLLLAVLAVVAVGIVAVAAYVFVLSKPQPQPVSTTDWIIVGVIFALPFALLIAVVQLGKRAAAGETQARHRVREAEDKLSNELRASPDLSRAQAAQQALRAERELARAVEVGRELARAVTTEREAAFKAGREAGLALARREDRLTLAALWDVTHSRMDLYHQIVTRHARNIFGAAQVAMAKSAAGLARTGHDLWGARPFSRVPPMTGAAMALVIGVSWACVGDLFGVGDYGDLTDEGVFHGGVEEEVGDVCARG